MSLFDKFNQVVGGIKGKIKVLAVSGGTVDDARIIEETTEPPASTGGPAKAAPVVSGANPIAPSIKKETGEEMKAQEALKQLQNDLETLDTPEEEKELIKKIGGEMK